MDKIVTKDGGVTFYNSIVGDHYHTKSGAIEEAFEKHARLLNVGSVEHPVIFDVCFGLGYNTAAALDLIKGACTIYCFENDPEILDKVGAVEAPFDSWKIVQEFVDKGAYKQSGKKLKLCYGDFRKQLEKMDVTANFVFFDPFSPAKVPELWSLRVFQLLFRKMKKGGKLSTYSCARFVRENMEKAGFVVIDGPRLGRRGPSTIAKKPLKEA